MKRLFMAGCALAVVLLSGCSTDREFTVTHEELVAAASVAICDEGYVTPAQIVRTERQEKGETITVLTAPYKRESAIECQIRSGAKHANPELEVVISTNKVLHTRHKEWEYRVHERVLQHLTSKPHGAEAKPSELPKVKPTLPPSEPPRKIDLK